MRKYQGVFQYNVGKKNKVFVNIVISLYLLFIRLIRNNFSFICREDLDQYIVYLWRSKVRVYRGRCVLGYKFRVVFSILGFGKYFIVVVIVSMSNSNSKIYFQQISFDFYKSQGGSEWFQKCLYIIGLLSRNCGKRY